MTIEDIVESAREHGISDDKIVAAAEKAAFFSFAIELGLSLGTYLLLKVYVSQLIADYWVAISVTYLVWSRSIDACKDIKKALAKEEREQTSNEEVDNKEDSIHSKAE